MSSSSFCLVEKNKVSRFPSEATCPYSPSNFCSILVTSALGPNLITTPHWAPYDEIEQEAVLEDETEEETVVVRTYTDGKMEGQEAVQVFFRR